MSHRKRLAASPRETEESPVYQMALQAMWEARWKRLGVAGRMAWFQCHGAWPPFKCPLVGRGSTRSVRLRRLRAAPR